MNTENNNQKGTDMKTFLVKFTGSNEWIEMQAESNDELKKKLRGENKSGVIKSPQNMEETMNKPKVHDKHAKTAPADAIYIGRGGKWGNPFIIGKDGTREEVIAKYEKYILGNAELLAQIHELKGKDLVCFCAPKACHGDVLLRLANNKMEEAMEAKKETPSAALVKLEKLSPEEIEWITNKLEEKILPNLQSDVSNYAKGRQRVWLPYEAPLGNQPFTPGLMDDEVWQWIVDRCAKHGFKAQLALISKGGNIKPHRDTTFAAPWAMGFNLGKCDWHIASSREIARTDYTMSLAGGEVFKFNSKHVHAVTNATADRWSINVWAIANGPAAENANISGRLEQMLEKHPEVQEFIELHQPGATATKSKEETEMKAQQPETKKEAKTPEVKPQKKKEDNAMIQLEGGVMLNAMQARAFDLVVNGNGNVLLTGNAGTGKSFLTNLIVKTMKAKGNYVLVTATTGIAATHIDGGTYHSILRILPIHDINKDGHNEMPFDMKVEKTVRDIVDNKEALARLKRADLIVVDEVSMMHKVDFGRIDHAFRKIFNPGLPFGGKRFLFVGDFLQIEPVEKDKRKKGPFFAYATKAWANANIEIVQLTKIVRQQDAFFAAFLNNVRQAILSEATQRILFERIAADFEGVEGLIFFSPTNKEVDEVNRKMLADINSEEFCYNAVDRVYRWQREDYWDNNCLAPKVLKLKVGAQVINLKNDAEKGIVNGDVGIVTDLTAAHIKVYFYRLKRELRMETVHFHQGDPINSSRIQFPVKPAWALSIHKSQGMTLDKVCISFGKAFASGQVYVALSRVRSLDGLFINEGDFDKIKADPSALSFYGLVGNVKGADAEAVCHIANLDNDDPDDGGSQPAVVNPIPNNDNGGSNADTPNKEETNMKVSENIEQKLVEELNKIVEQERKDRMKRLEKMEGSRMWAELLVEENALDLLGGHGTLSRIITNDPIYWVKKLNVRVVKEIDMGGYHYALLDHLFNGESVCAQVTAFKHPEKTDDGDEILQKVAVRRPNKPEDVIFGFADFDAEYLIRVKGFSSSEYSTMEEYNLKIGNSSKMVKRLVELFKKSPGYRIHDGENRFSIKIVSYEDLLKAFPEIKELEKAGKMGDGINIGSTKVAKYIYRGSKHLTKSQKGRILRGIDNGEYMNHTVRILTNINGVAGLIKGNMILGDMEQINARFRDAGIIGANESYEIFTTPDNFKEEFGTNGVFEIATLDPHHGPGPVKTNDQMIAQYMDVRGMCTPNELLEAFEKYMDKAYDNMVEGKDIQYLDKIQADRPENEADRITEIRGSMITTVVNKMAATLNELNLPLSVSQTMMLQRANLIIKMFLAEQDSRGNKIEVGKNWQAPSSAKKSFVFMPWAYWAYILPKEIIHLAGYDINLTGDEYMEAEYHEETGTIMVPGALYDEIMARLGGGDGDDRVMVQIRKMIMKDGSVRLVAVLIRTPNDWNEYWIIDVNIDKFGPVFVADDMDVEMPTIYEEDFEKFKKTSVCGKLPSAISPSDRPSPARWDWASTRYNYTVWPYTGTKVGGQVKTKMLQYSTRNAPFATLPCANEDMIDAIQQCKGDARDMEVLNDWSTAAILDLVLTEKLDAYWWYSRNMYGTVKMLKATGRIHKTTKIQFKSATESAIVTQLMVPREQIIRQTHAKMMDWLNHNITEIDELSICISRQTEDKYKLLVTNLNKKFNGTIGMNKKQRSEHFEKAAQAVMDELNKYKEENTEEEFFRHILRLVRMSYLMKERSLKQNWNQKNPNNNYDRWLFTAVTDAEVIPTDYFFQAMIWFRDTFKKN